MFVKSDPECSESDLTKGVMVDEEDIISQLFFQFSLSCLSCRARRSLGEAWVYPVKKFQISLADFYSLSFVAPNLSVVLFSFFRVFRVFRG